MHQAPAATISSTPTRTRCLKWFGLGMNQFQRFMPKSFPTFHCCVLIVVDVVVVIVIVVVVVVVAETVAVAVIVIVVPKTLLPGSFIGSTFPN